LFWRHGAIGLNLHGYLIEIDALTNANIVNAEVHHANRRVYCIYGDNTDRKLVFLALFGRNVATAFFDSELHLQGGLLATNRADKLLRVDELNIGWKFDGFSGDCAFFFGNEVNDDGIRYAISKLENK
jgi:hypothetical protein